MRAKGRCCGRVKECGTEKGDAERGAEVICVFGVGPGGISSEELRADQDVVR